MNLGDLEALNARERAALVDRLELELQRPVSEYRAVPRPLRELQRETREAFK